LDEPTSALDSFSEEAVTIAINNLFKWRTVIVIAHRLQTVKEADDIIILDEFKIIERWTHRKLLKDWKYYKKMVDLQSWLLID
jgi:ABC-type multidrug transport system fused ATPase/permease subunit